MLEGESFRDLVSTAPTAPPVPATADVLAASPDSFGHTYIDDRGGSPSPLVTAPVCGPCQALWSMSPLMTMAVLYACMCVACCDR